MTPTPQPIRPLSEHLINQIAAGEVIERPASVVKELIENALDAGARRIEVELAAGGIERIVVSDDGSGIPGAEIGAALTRHWTSKLSSATELDAIVSLGFRGEALASIAAVAGVAITTRTANAAHAWHVAVAPGAETPAPKPAQGNRGTRIEVLDLFHRIPARRRFLKQARTEYLHVHRLVRQYAFARPDVAFSLDQQGARGLRLRAAERHLDAARWRALFGKAFCDSARVIDLQADGIAMWGWVGGPELATNHADLQFLAVNARVIRDKQIAHAVRLAFGDAIAPGRFPAYALAIEIAPTAVDVNVHPGKLEVRFADLRELHDRVYAALRASLDSTSLAPAGAPSVSPAPALSTTPRVGDTRSRYTATPPARGEPSAVGVDKPLALVEQRYLLFMRDHAVAVMDLRQCWQQVITARLRASAATSRPLLIPQRMARTPRHAALIEHPELAALGFIFEELGSAGSILRAVPKVLPGLDYVRFVDRLVQELEEAPDVYVAVGAAAAATVPCGERGQVARAMLEDLLRMAAAVGCDPVAAAVSLDAQALGALLQRRD